MLRYTSLLFLILASACSTTEVAPAPPLPEVPEYTRVEHPQSMDTVDLRAIFSSPNSLKGDALAQCDQDYLKLKAAAQTPHEMDQGVSELVQSDPKKYHWCFYSRLTSLNEEIKKVPAIKERQAKVLDTYFFLYPVARAFHFKFNDTRYIRAAIHFYRGLSEWVFNRKLEPTPQMTQDLMSKQLQNPFGFYRPMEEGSRSVLEKYGIVPTEAPRSLGAPQVSHAEVEATPPSPAAAPAAAPETVREPSAEAPPATTDLPEFD